MKRFLIASVIAGTALTVAACGGSTDTDPTTQAQTVIDDEGVPSLDSTSEAPAATPELPQIAEVGQRVQYTDDASSWALTVNGTRRLPEAEGDIGITPVSPDGYLVVSVTVECLAGACSANPFYFTLSEEATGLQHSSDIMGIEHSFQGAELTPGRKVTGEMAYDVPAAAYLLDYNPSYGVPAATFRINA